MEEKMELVAKTFRIPKTSIAITSGAKSRQKTLNFN